jgi:hypothetical protein
VTLRERAARASLRMLARLVGMALLSIGLLFVATVASATPT